MQIKKKSREKDKALQLQEDESQQEHEHQQEDEPQQDLEDEPEIPRDGGIVPSEDNVLILRMQQKLTAMAMAGLAKAIADSRGNHPEATKIRLRAASACLDGLSPLHEYVDDPTMVSRIVDSAALPTPEQRHDFAEALRTCIQVFMTMIRILHTAK